jgi:Cd2+/Zn2+-exporting ATPase
MYDLESKEACAAVADACGCCSAHDGKEDEGGGGGLSSGSAASGAEADGCACCRAHSGGEGEDGGGLKSVVFIAGVVLFVAGMALTYSGVALSDTVRFAIFAAAYLAVAKNVLLCAAKNIASGKVFDENFLMTIASLGAFAIGEYPEAVAVILFYNVGEYMQERMVRRSRKSIENLMDIRPDVANLIKGDGEVSETPAEAVRVGDLILIRPGEKIPLDGAIEEGVTTLDTRALTGESLPRDAGPGDAVLSGFINGSGLLRVRVGKAFADSTASKILEMMEKAADRKAKTENFITIFASRYTPAVVGIAALLAVVPPLAGFGAFSEWIYRALVFLVVSCPCALVISIPLGFFGGLGAASAKGILIKGGNFLEALTRVDAVVFDKTGTLTKGHFRVAEILPAEGVTEDELLALGALAERRSTHPIALSVCELYAARGKAPADEASAITEFAGFGVRARTGAGETILVGNRRLMEREGVDVPALDKAGTPVYIALQGHFAGELVIADELRADSRKAVDALRARGVGRIAMLTGDSRRIAAGIGGELGLDLIEAELLPGDKVDALERIVRDARAGGGKKRGLVLFAGDGVNDAPVLAGADIGVAMGGIGSDAAIEAADIVIMNDEPSKIALAIDIARSTRRIVWQNIALALGVKFFVLALAALGFATMWEAVFADVGVAVLATLNAVRAGRGL